MTLQLIRFTDAARAAEAALNASTCILGGGTLLMRAVNMGDVSIGTLVRLDESADKNITVDGGTITVGARVTMAQLADHPQLGWLAPVARSIGGPAVRAMATVGGNLHAPSPYGDLATALLALDAEVALHTPEGGQKASIKELLAGRDGRLQSAVIRNVSFAAPSAPLLFRKVSRVRPKGAAVLTIAAILNEEGGTIRRARIAYGAMGATPVRAMAAEAALRGKTRTPDGVADALALALEGVTPADDPIASAWYRRAVLPVHLRRLLLNEEAGEA